MEKQQTRPDQRQATNKRRKKFEHKTGETIQTRYRKEQRRVCPVSVICLSWLILSFFLCFIHAFCCLSSPCLDLVFVVCLCCVNCFSLCFCSPSLCVVFSVVSSRSCLVLFASGLVLPALVYLILFVCLVRTVSCLWPVCALYRVFFIQFVFSVLPCEKKADMKHAVDAHKKERQVVVFSVFVSDRQD